MAKAPKKPKALSNVAVKKPSLDIKSIALGSLVGEVRESVVEFYHDGKIESVKIRIKQLPYAVTESLHRRFNKEDDKVIAEWIAAALVDENDKSYISAEQVEQHFTQALAGSIFSEVSGLRKLQEYAENLGKGLALKKNSGQNLSSTELVEAQ